MALLSCRHCYARDEFAACSHKQSYVGTIIYGSMQELLQRVEAVEKHGGGPIPGITAWCEACGAVSMVSHRYHKELCMRVDGMKEEDVVGLHEYYTRMCVGAELALRLQHLSSGGGV